MIRSTCSLLFLATALAAQAPTAVATLEAPSPQPATNAPTDPSRAIDLVICLDTSGSMSGLINAARQNLWAVVNDLATLQPQPDLRVALLTYGTPAYGAESGFVKVQTGLTDDLDLVSQRLFELGTNGGSEYVARVVRRALDELDWAKDPKALKLLFVAGNESAMQDPAFDALAQSRDAINRGVLVNTIYCGNLQHQDAAGWQQVAKLADGKFASIDKDQAVVIETPFDAQLAELSASLNKTYVPYGKGGAECAGNQWAQDGNAAGMNPAAAAQRAQSKACGLYSNSRWDLVDACKDQSFELAKVEKETLPKELQELSFDELKAHVAKMEKQRAALQEQIVELGGKRDAFVREEQQRRAKKGDKLFEQAVLESVRDQACSRGFERKVEAKVEQQPEVGPFEKIVLEAAEQYRSFVRVTGSPKVAPTDCRIPGPFARRSQASKQHGGKLYVLYARHADGVEYVREGEPAKVGQTLVKESWQCVEGAPQGPTEASRRYPGGLTLHEGLGRFHAGDAHGLFVMHKLAADTPGTDQGWVYGTVDRAGKVTSAGKVASCIKCHVDADNDRRFGLD